MFIKCKTIRKIICCETIEVAIKVVVIKSARVKATYKPYPDIT